jgi:ribosomal protein S27E
MELAPGLAVYKPRKPKQTLLWQILADYFDQFEQSYEVCYTKAYGFFRPVISRVVRKYLDCGDLHQGFARVRCPDCHHEYLLAFSCRGRWFCPSCHAKKVVQFGGHLQANVLYPVPHRQYVFSMPKILRGFFKYNRKLLGKLCHCAQQSLLDFFRVVLRKPRGIGGTIMAIQTFGDYCRWHPHLHAIVSDGLYMESGYFFVMPKNVDLQPLKEIFRARVLAMLKKEGLVGDDFLQMIMQWRHTSGFSVHNQVRIARDDTKGQEALAQYIIRNPFSLKKLQYQEKTG